MVGRNVAWKKVSSTSVTVEEWIFLGKFLWGNPTSLRDSKVNGENGVRS